MKKPTISKADILRQKAEELLKNKLSKSGAQLTEAKTKKLIHELEVHQIELELQNEELIRAQEETKLVTEKYIELFDFAPIGYYRLSKEGEILELNLAGAKILGKNRVDLKNKPFVRYVSENTKPAFNLFFKKTVENQTKETCVLALSTKDNISMQIELTGIVYENGNQCFVTATDVTNRLRIEGALRDSEKQLQKRVKQATLKLNKLNTALKSELDKRKFSQKELRKSIINYKKLFSYLHNVREEERLSIARIIHDDLAQLLTTLKLELTSNKAKTDQLEPESHASIDSMLFLVEECITSLKSVITELRPVILDELGLIPALKKLFSDFQSHSEIPCDVRNVEDTCQVEKKITIAIYRVVEEALTNIRNHANATYVTAKISGHPSYFSIILKDNGRGISEQESSNSRSFGIIGMKERITAIGGRITFTGIPGKGTTIKLKVPLK